MTWTLLIALGLLFLAAEFIVDNSTARIACAVVAAVAFLLAAIVTIVGNPWTG